MMKKFAIGLLTLSAAIFFHVSKASAQGAYIRAYGGYSLGAAKSLLPGYLQTDVFENEIGLPFEFPAYNLTIQQDLTTDQNYVRESYGSGANAGLAVGYMFSKYVGAEIGVSYLFGKDIGYRSDFKHLGTIVDFNSKLTMLQINPAVVFTTGSEVVSPYARFGVLIATAAKVKTVAVSPTDDYSLEDELRKGTSLGASAALGINYHVSDNVALFLEAEYKGMSYKPEERGIIKIIDGGVEMDPASIYDHPVQILQDNSSAFEPNFSKQSRMSTPFSVSSIGLNAGVMFKLGGGGSPRGR